LRRSPRYLHDTVKLIHRRSAWENRLSIEELTEDAANAPDVHSFGIAVRPQQDLRSSVPPCGDVVGQNWIGVTAILVDAARKAEVADTDMAI